MPSRQLITIPFGEWLPDLPDLNNPGSTIAKNVVPGPTSYRPLKTLTAVTSALTAYARGHFYETDDAGTTFNYAGDETNLYVDNALTWDDVSGATYTTGSSEKWEFAKFADKVYAVNFTDNMQVVTIGNVANTFADASGSPPKARHIAVVRDFLVLGNTSTGGTNTPERLHWSGINDPSTWTIDATTQADVHDFPDSGGVQAIAGGEYGVIFQEHAVTRMTYAGSPVIFQMDKVLPDIGMLDPGGSMVQLASFAYYIGEDGFRVICNGQQTERIGANKVDRTMLAELDYSNLHRISGAVDPINNVVYWALPVTGNTGGLPNKLYIYDITNKRWSFAEVEVQLVTSAPTSSTSDVDTFGAFDASNQLGYFTGAELQSTLETLEVEMNPGLYSMMRSVNPLVTGGTSETIQVGARRRQQDAFAYDSDSYTAEPSGWFRVRSRGRSHRIRYTGTFTGDALGVNAVGVRSGMR